MKLSFSTTATVLLAAVAAKADRIGQSLHHHRALEDDDCQTIAVYRRLQTPSVNGNIEKPSPDTLKFGDVIAQKSFLCEGLCDPKTDPSNQVGNVYATATFYRNPSTGDTYNPSTTARVGKGGYYFDGSKWGTGSILFFSTVLEKDVGLGFEVDIIGGTGDFRGVSGWIFVGSPESEDPPSRKATLHVCGLGDSDDDD